MDKSTSEPSECETCQHYRPQASFVDAHKVFDESGTRLPILKSLQELRKAETEVLENEVGLLYELVRGEEIEWPSPPRFAPVCAAGGKVAVATLKNKNNDCKDYDKAVNREGGSCRTCRFVLPPQRRVGDRHTEMTGGMNESERAFVRQNNKDKADADATAHALEIEQSFYGDGRAASIVFLPTCGIKTSGRERHVVPSCNIRGDCADHSPYLPVSAPLLWNPPSHPVPRFLEVTIALARMIADAGPEKPMEFLRALKAWFDKQEGEPIAAAAASWSTLLLSSRWGPMAGLKLRHFMEDVGFDPKALLAAGSLRPVVVGADAFEWGLLAYSSRLDDDSRRQAGQAICQQIAEFTATVIRPGTGALGLDAVWKLVCDPQLFTDDLRGEIASFMRRLPARADELRQVAMTDLYGWYEGCAGTLSYAVATWLRSSPNGPEHQEMAATMFGQGFAGRWKERHEERLREARAEGESILRVFAELEDPALTPDVRSRIAANMSRLNETSLRHEVSDLTELGNQLLDFVGARQPAQNALAGALGGLGGWGGLGDQYLNSFMKQKEDERYQSLEAVHLRWRRVLISLTILRCATAITPAAIELLGIEPAMGIPDTLEQAVRHPVAKTIEARYGPPVQYGDIMARQRRTAAPAYAAPRRQA